MGKKRIKIMKAETTAVGGVTPKAGKAPKEQKGRKIVKTGKEHGRITDMGAVALAEAEKIKEKELEFEKLAAVKAKKGEKGKAKKPARKRGKKYLTAKKQVDRTKLYPIVEAIKLVKATSISRFNGKIEVHLVIREKGLKKEVKLPHKIEKQIKLKIASEKKAPLIHLVIGKLDAKESDLSDNFQAIIEAVGTKSIKKAVLTSTMGPGVKVDIDNL